VEAWGCCSTGSSNGGAATSCSCARGGGSCVLRDGRNGGDSGRGTAATSVGARTGGQRTDRRTARCVAGRSGANGGLACGVRTTRCFGAWGPWEGAQPRKARVAQMLRTAQHRRGAHGRAECTTSRSGVKTVSMWPCLKAKNSKKLNKTPPCFEYESCRALLGEYFS
jgi:hypothetical protein